MKPKFFATPAAGHPAKQILTIKTLQAHIRVHLSLLIKLSSTLLVNRTCYMWNAQKEDKYCLCSEDQSGHLPV